MGRLEGGTSLAKRDLDELRQRWQRAELIHPQRLELMKNLKAQR